jgi:signal peptidase I
MTQISQNTQIAPVKKQVDIEKKVKRLAKSLGISVGIFAVILTLFYFFVGWFYRVDSINMYPTLADGDLVVYEKITPIAAKDIVVYEYAGKVHIGRVFGVEGDEVGLRTDGYTTINGSLPYETHIFYPTFPVEKSIKYPLTVSPGHVFILGDYRTGAVDSRTFGEIPLSQVKGKVYLLLLRQRGLYN